MRKLTYILCLFALVSMFSCEQGPRMVQLDTEYGTMKIELYDSTPQHRDNFIKLASEGFYDDLLFHRVINGFMIQGGDPESKNASSSKRLGGGGPGYLIPAEIGSPHFKGTLAAARTGGPMNPEKESSGSQFYIVQGNAVDDTRLDQIERQKGVTYNETQRKKYKEMGGTPMLDMDYTVFGEVVEGLDVIDKIAAVKTAPGDRPVEDVKMKIKVIR